MALRLRGATSGYIELKAPASAGDNTLTLPTNNGSANQLLKTDGSGNLSWTDDNSGVSLSGSTNNTIATVTGANALTGEANLIFDGSNLGVNCTPSSELHVKGSNEILRLETTSTTGGNYINFNDADENKAFVGLGSSIDDSFSVWLSKSSNLRFATGDTEKMRIDSNGRIKIGTTSAAATNEAVTIKGDSNGDCFISLRSSAHADGNDQKINFMVGDAIWQSGNVTSQLSSEIIQTSSGVLKANLVISANRGDALTNRYIIYGDNSVDHEFKTKTAASLLKLHNSGLVEIADGDLKVANGHGIDFSATSGTGTSELLNDYEEGTFTPTWGGAAISSVNYSAQFGKYTKIGNRVFGVFRVTSTGHTGSGGVAQINGFPFTAFNNTSAYHHFTFGHMTGFSYTGSPYGYVISDNTYAKFVANNNGSNTTIPYPTSGTIDIIASFMFEA